jgi:hypothetical protein
MKVSELPDSIEIIFLQNFSTLHLAVFVVQGCENHKNCIFWHATSTKNYHNFSSQQATKLI